MVNAMSFLHEEFSMVHLPFWKIPSIMRNKLKRENARFVALPPSIGTQSYLVFTFCMTSWSRYRTILAWKLSFEPWRDVIWRTLKMLRYDWRDICCCWVDEFDENLQYLHLFGGVR